MVLVRKVVATYRKFKDYEKQLEETKGMCLYTWVLLYIHSVRNLLSLFVLTFVVVSALAKDDGIDEDMAEMINFEIGSLSSQIQELEAKLMVLFYMKDLCLCNSVNSF